MAQAWIWIPLVVAASGLQTARNAGQRGLMAEAGPWGATLVRFLYGLPFALVWLALVAAFQPGPLDWGAARFWAACAAAGLAQMLATAALLVSMRRSSFAVGSALQHFRLTLSAVFGVFLGDGLGGSGWLGVALATGGLLLMSWPRPAEGARADWSAAGLGFAAGALVAVSGNGIREASQAAAPASAWLGAAASLVAIQALQTLALSAWLVVSDRRSLKAVAAAWRTSLGVGFLGTAASACWFTAFGMAPAAAVQAVGVVEIPMSAVVGRRVFRERMTVRQGAGGVLAALGVVLTAYAGLGL